MTKCNSCGKLFFGSTSDYCTKCGAPMPGTAASRTIDGGIQMMKRNRFTDATNIWRAYVKAYGEPSYRDYQSILESIKDCVFSHLSDSDYYSRNGISDLAIVLNNRDLMRDVLNIYVDSITDAKTKRQLHRLFAEYIYVAFESFSVYPDTSDMAEILDNLSNFSDKCLSRLPTLPGESKNADTEFAFFKDYASFFANEIRSKISEEGPERMNTIVSFWKNQPSLTYSQLALEASMNFSKAKTSRRPSDKKDKNAELKLDKFFDMYFGMPFKESKKKK